MVLCIAKPTPGCACIFTALTVTVAVGLVCIMALLQASLAAHGHIWALDLAVAREAPSINREASARMASSIDFALAAERDAFHVHMRNATLELSSRLLTRLDSLRTEIVQSAEFESLRKQQRELLDAESHHRREVTEGMVRLQSNMRRDMHQLRGELLNLTMEQGREISELLLEYSQNQLKSLEGMRLRGTEKAPEKKKSAIGEGLWGLLSAVKETERETTPKLTETPSTTSTTAQPSSTSEQIRETTEQMAEMNLKFNNSSGDD